MLRLISLVAALMIGSLAVASAATLNLPMKGKTGATVTIPDGWSSKVTDDGYEISVKDDTVAVFLGTDPAVTPEADVVKEVAKEFGKDLEISPGSVKSANDQVNGMKAVVTHLLRATRRAAAPLTSRSHRSSRRNPASS